MLTTRDRDWMERSAGSSGLPRERLLHATTGVMLILTFVNVGLSARWAQIQEVAFSQVLSGWSSGIRPDLSYSGVYLRALNRLDVAFACLCVALAAAVGAYAIRRERQRSGRILAALRVAGSGH